MSDHWAVTVERNGEKIVTIESNCLSGRDITAADEDTIRTAAQNLLSFIGDGPLPPRSVAISIFEMEAAQLSANKGGNQ